MRSGRIAERSLVIAMGAAVAVGGACSDTQSSGGARATSPRSAPSRAEVAGSFTLHEWGLVGVVAGESAGAVGSGVSSHGPSGGPGSRGYGYGGKPVISIHLDEGTREARLDVSLGLPRTSIVEAFPTLSASESVAWKGVHATRGACASPTPAPTADADVCRNTVDGFCEAAELPRYEADRDVCLEVGDARVSSLFYRASALDTSTLPLVLDVVESPTLRRSGGGRLDGPVLYLEKGADGAPVIHALPSDVGSGPAPTGSEATISAADVRLRLVAEARRRGLTEAEADAFVDAWSPAFFDTCRRTGPEASGDAPTALAPADRSLLYFAPEATVDALLPLETRPRARARSRVFLVRVVEAPPMGHGGGGFFSPESTPREAGDVVVRMGQAEVRGALSPEVVRRIARRHIGEIRFCYEQGLASRPTLAGRVVVGAVIGTNGAVTTAATRNTTLGNASVEGCIVNAIRRWEFPTPESGIVVWSQPYALYRTDPQ